MLYCWVTTHLKITALISVPTLIISPASSASFRRVFPMSNSQIQRFWQLSYGEYTSSGSFQSDVQSKASYAILNCKSGRLGVNISQCPDCGHIEVRNNSCRNRNCPQIKNTSAQSPASSRYSIPGIRRCFTMYICIALSLAAGSPRTIIYKKQRKASSSP